LALLHDFIGILDTAVAHVLDVQQAVHAVAQRDERPIGHDLPDQACDRLTLGQGRIFLFPRLFLLHPKDVTAGHDDAFLFVPHLDDLALEPAVHIAGQIGVLDPEQLDLADGHESLDAVDVQFQAALVVAGDPAFDDMPFFQPRPGRGHHRPLAGQPQNALAAVISLDGHLNHIPHGGKGVILVLRGRQDTLALAAHVYEDVVAVNGDDPASLDPFGTRREGHSSRNVEIN